MYSEGRTRLLRVAKHDSKLALPPHPELEKVVGLTGFVIIHVFIASFSPVQGECNQMVNTKFTRPVNEMPMSILNGLLVYEWAEGGGAREGEIPVTHFVTF